MASLRSPAPERYNRVLAWVLLEDVVEDVLPLGFCVEDVVEDASRLGLAWKTLKIN